MSTALVLDGGPHIVVGLCACECARSAAACSSLQRLLCAISPIVPVSNHVRATCDSVASSECSEGMGGGECAVLQEDMMLEGRTQLLHSVVEGEGGEEVRSSQTSCLREGKKLHVHLHTSSDTRK
jgi:hypothetical protein